MGWLQRRKAALVRHRGASAPRFSETMRLDQISRRQGKKLSASLRLQRTDWAQRFLELLSSRWRTPISACLGRVGPETGARRKPRPSGAMVVRTAVQVPCRTGAHDHPPRRNAPMHSTRAGHQPSALDIIGSYDFGELGLDDSG